MNPIRVASVQFCHRPDDKAYNLQQVQHWTEEAKQRGASLVVFPEMCITGYWHVRNLNRDQVEKLSEPVPFGPTTEALLSLAKASGVSVGAGLIERAEDGRLYNSYVVAMSNGEFVCHRKIHCFISEHLSSGEQFTVFDLPEGIRTGILICYDNNLGENVRCNALAGAQLLLAPHQTGGCHTPSPRCMGSIDPALWQNRDTDREAIETEFRGAKGREWLLRWLPARAHDNGLFLVFSNGVGEDDGEVRTGNAMILDAYGEILAETWKAQDDMVVADLDPSMIEMSTGRRWIRSRRPELYEAISTPTGFEQDTRHVRFSTTK